MMLWSTLTAIASIVTAVIYLITVYYLRMQIKAAETDRYLAVTNELFTLWQSREFMEAQMWLLHRLKERTWEEFVAAHRGDTGEIAFHRVGSFYDRVGTLVRLKLINDKEILATMGGHAIAVWHKIDGLVAEARRIENSTLFTDFEAMLPSCYSCYVPALADTGGVNPFSAAQPVHRMSIGALRKALDHGKPITILDVRQPGDVAKDPRTLPGALMIPPDDVPARCHEIPPDREVVAFCS